MKDVKVGNIFDFPDQETCEFVVKEVHEIHIHEKKKA